MEILKKLSHKQIKGLTTRIDQLNIPMLGKRFLDNLEYYPKISDSLCTNSQLHYDLNKSMIIFFLYCRGKEDVSADNYGLGTKKIEQIDKSLKQFDLSLSIVIDKKVLENLIISLSKERNKKERRDKRLSKLKISELPKLRKDVEEDRLIKEFLDMHFETFYGVMNLSRYSLNYLKKPEGLHYWLIRDSIENFLKKELDN
jgi:hypothetical protein